MRIHPVDTTINNVSMTAVVAIPPNVVMSGWLGSLNIPEPSNAVRVAKAWGNVYDIEPILA